MLLFLLSYYHPSRHHARPPTTVFAVSPSRRLANARTLSSPRASLLALPPPPRLCGSWAPSMDITQRHMLRPLLFAPPQITCGSGSGPVQRTCCLEAAWLPCSRTQVNLAKCCATIKLLRIVPLLPPCSCHSPAQSYAPAAIAFTTSCNPVCAPCICQPRT